MKTTRSILFYVGLVVFTCTASTNAQFIVIENCVEEITVNANGIFSVRCAVKNLSARGDFSVLAFADNASVEVTPKQKILSRNESVLLSIRGMLIEKRNDGRLEIELRWSDYEGKAMITRQLIRVVSSGEFND